MLVVTDYQVDFVDGVFGLVPDAKAIEPRVYDKVCEAMRRGDCVMFTMDTHDANGYEQSREGALFGRHCVEGTPGWNLYGRLSEFQNAGTLLRKSAFGSFELAERARAMDVKHIEIIGVCTDICVLSNAILLYSALPEARITVDASACAAFSREAHAAAIAQMRALGIAIVNGQPVRAEWDGFLLGGEAVRIESALPEARITVDASACAAFSREAHATAIAQMRAPGIAIVNGQPVRAEGDEFLFGGEAVRIGSAHRAPTESFFNAANALWLQLRVSRYARLVPRDSQ